MSVQKLYLFKGRTLVIATMHGKEKVIAPILEKALGVKIKIPENFNTDQYGTFTGEIDRELNPIEVAKVKCIAASKSTGCSLAVASEGSFGAHPSMYFMPADDEVMVFMDLKNDIIIKARVLSTQTNFNSGSFTDWSSAKEFSTKIGFPSHKLILRKEQSKNNEVIKGIDNWNLLKDTFYSYFAKFGSVFLETDMRAMHNPTRMQVIEEATTKLVEVILCKCPDCNLPGYDVEQAIGGLPCELCNMPTKSTLALKYKCMKCNYSTIKEFPYGKVCESPQFCDFCNP